MKRFLRFLPILSLIFCSFLLFIPMTNDVHASNGPDPFFSVHMVAPTSCPVRMLYSQLVEPEINKIGIETELDLISWAALGPRATDQEVGQYSEGGYDICFFGMSLGTPMGHPGESMKLIFGSTAIPPEGFNVMYWSPETGKDYNNYRAAESDILIDNIATNLNLTEVKTDLYEWQKIWYDVMPNIVIYNQYEVHAVSKGLYGYDPIKYPLNSIEDVWFESDYTGNASQVVLAASTGGETFNPMIATDVYDQYMNNPAFDGLVGNTPSKEANLPYEMNRDTWMTNNYNTTDYLALYPRIASAMGSYSSNGLSYTLDIRDDVYFHDGIRVDAWDVAMSFQAHLIPEIDSPSYSNLILPFGMDDKANNHGNYSFTVTDADNDGFFEHINFTLNQIFAPFETTYLGTWIFPEHILGDPVGHGFDSTGEFDPDSLWTTKPGDWRHHSTCTSRTTDPGGYLGPIGCGSMILESFDSATSTAIFKKFDKIMWDNTTGEWVTNNSNSHWNIAKLGNMPDTAKIIVKSMDSAIAEMKTNEVNIIDPQFTMGNILDELQTEATIQSILSPETGWQAMYFNPKFTQDDIRHLNKKGVRHAFSHAIPRDDIISLMTGLGLPAYTPVPITSWAAIPEVELMSYKQALRASDGSTLLANSSTAYDQFSLDLAFDWLDSEGYDTSEWRMFHSTQTTVTPTPGFEFFIIPVSMMYFTILFRQNRRR